MTTRGSERTRRLVNDSLLPGSIPPTPELVTEATRDRRLLGALHMNDAGRIPLGRCRTPSRASACAPTTSASRSRCIDWRTTLTTPLCRPKR